MANTSASSKIRARTQSRRLVKSRPVRAGVDSSQELTAHAPGDDAVVRCGVQAAELAAGHGHRGLVQFGFENQRSGRAKDGQ